MSSAAFQFAWVEKHFGHEFLEHVILTRDKTIVSGHVLIDDRPDIVGKVGRGGAGDENPWRARKGGPVCTISESHNPHLHWLSSLSPSGVERTPAWDQVLFTACHNKHLQLPASCPRLHSWADDWRAILESKRGC